MLSLWIDHGYLGEREFFVASHEDALRKLRELENDPEWGPYIMRYEIRAIL